MTYAARVVGHSHVKTECIGATAHDALNNLWASLSSYSNEAAQQCREFWTPDEIEADLALLGRVEGYCGAFAWELLP
jgi:hypothetical protein